MQLKSQMLPCDVSSTLDEEMRTIGEHERVRETLTEIIVSRIDELHSKIEEDLSWQRESNKTLPELLEKYDRSMSAIRMEKHSAFGPQSLSQRRSAPTLRISQSNIKTEPEMIIYNKREIPSPADYMVKQRVPQPCPGGKFNGSGRIELKPDNFSVPGPGAYGDVSRSKLPAGGKFNNANVPDFITVSKRKGSRLPGPLDYKPSHRVSRTPIPAVRFTKCFPKSDVDWKVYHASKIPGPGAYKVVPPKRTTSGQKFSSSYVKSFIDEAVHKGRAVPGPKYAPQNSADESGRNKRNFLWDVGGISKHSSSVDQLIRAAQSAGDQVQPKTQTRKQQQRQAEKLSESKRRNLYLQELAEVELVKDRMERRVHRRRYATYTSPYAHPLEQTARPCSPSSPDSPVRLKPLPMETEHSGKSHAKKRQKREYRRRGKRKKFMTIKETMRLSRQMLREEEQAKKAKALMNGLAGIN